ncbi:MAG: peroxidase-related enzyme [Gemmatimonadota bacterium]|nr:peroxidase-related enzyme [Gemmatimonadota bacterium]
MPRIPGVSDEDIHPKAGELLAATERKLGRVPNLFRGLAHSPAALEAYLSLGEKLSAGALSAELREKIALTMAGANQCAYCAAAHTAIGQSLSIEPAELTRALLGDSEDPRTAALLDLTNAIVEKRGAVADEELARARAAGITDAEIAEVVANVALNVLTNYFNRLAETEVDFPAVPVAEAA